MGGGNTTKQQLVAHRYYSSNANLSIKFEISHSISRYYLFIYLFIYALHSFLQTPNNMSVEPLSENTVLETVNGSNLFSFSDPTEKTKLFYLWFSKTSHY
jgi:hypothetical protein